MLADLLNDLSVEVWDFLEAAGRAGFSPREETVTENLLVAMSSRARGRVRIRKTTAREEARTGADFAWALQHRSGRWASFLVQAKKLNPRTKSYLSLRDPGAWAQLRNLWIEANATEALPVYLLYNGEDFGREGDVLRFGRCCRSSLHRQREGPPWSARTSPAGCTLIAAAEINELLWEGAASSPPHVSERGMPWECLLCPRSEHENHPLWVVTAAVEGLDGVEDDLPPWVTDQAPAWVTPVLEGRSWEEDLTVPRASYYVVTEPAADG